jgi:hypothetical protein
MAALIQDLGKVHELSCAPKMSGSCPDGTALRRPMADNFPRLNVALIIATVVVAIWLMTMAFIISVDRLAYGTAMLQPVKIGSSR